MPVNVEFHNFDNGLDLRGGRETMGDNTTDGKMRIATATHPIHTGSARSRNGSTQILATQMISVFRFYTNRIGVDNSGNVWWLPDAVVAAEPLASWQANHVYALNTIIVDSNGNFQKVTTNGTSGPGPHPTWATTITSTTADNTVTWTMIGGIIKTGLTAGARVNFTKAPPQIGDTAYCFVSGGGVLFKIKSDGTVTNWGITAPADGMTATLGGQATTTIDALSTSAGWTLVNVGPGTSTKSDDTSFFVVSPSSIKLVCAPSSITRITKSITVDLTSWTTPLSGSNSFLQDVIRMYIAMDQPYLVDYVAVAFSLGDTTFKNQWHRKIVIQPARNDTLVNNLGSQNLWQIDNAVAGQTNLSNVYYNTVSRKIQVVPGERRSKHDILYNANGGIAHSAEWTAWHLPKETFVRIGTTTSLGWKDVQAVRINIACKSSSVTPTVWVNDMFMSGGVGMAGTYQYLVCFQNTTTGTLSNANPTPVVIQDVDRNAVSLASIPVSADPQVNARIILRTVGNGGYFYEDGTPTIADNSTTTYTDSTSDFFGLNGGTDPVNNNSAGNAGETTLTGPIFTFTHNPPAATYNRSTVWKGTMFWCGDTATGCLGRIYYSTLGDMEGAATYTDITNDDDPTQALCVWNNQLYLFTKKNVYAIYQSNDPNVVVNPSYPIPVFTGQLVTGAPGTSAPFSVVPTPNGIMYQSNENELMLMNGYTSTPVAPQILQLLRGESVEGYSAIGTIIAAAYGRLEYLFSDGTQSFAYNVMDSAIRSLGVPLTALFFEPDTGKFSASNATFDWVLYEESGVFADNGSGIPFTFQTPSGYVRDEKYDGQVRYIIIDANLNSQSLTPTLLLDNQTIAFSAITNSARGITELTCSLPGRLVGLKLAGTPTSQVEIFRVAFDVEPAGNTDDSTMAVGG